LILVGHDLKLGASIASEKEVQEFNRRTITMSERNIFATTVSTELKRQIAELKSVRAGFVLDSLFYGDGSIHVSRFIPVQ
jgi:hypothetical protein